MTDSTTPPASVADSETELTEELTELSVGPWWWVLIRGILAIVFGVIALVSPGAAAWAIAIVFGAYAIVDGVTEIAHAIQVRTTLKRWGWLLFAGIVSVLAGIAALVLPGLAAAFGALFFIWTMVFYNITHGATVIGSASGAEAKGKSWAIFAGVVSIVFGVVLAILAVLTPLEAIVALIIAIGIYAIVFGVMLAVSAISVRASGKKDVTVGTN